MPTTADESRPVTLSVESLAKLIDAELSHLASESTRRGMTLWVLLVALAATVWAMFGQTTAGLRSEHVLLSMMGVAVAIDLVTDLAFQVRSRQFPHSRRVLRVDTLQAIFACSATCLLLVGLRSGAFLLILAHCWAHHSIPPDTALLGVGIFSFYLLSLVGRHLVLTRFAGLVVPLGRAGTPQSETTRTTPTRHGIVSVRWGFFAVRGAFVVSALREVVSAHEWLANGRMGALAATALFILHLLSHVSQTSPLVLSLVALRRGLVLGTSNVADTASELESLLLGARASSALQATFIPLVEALGAARESLRKMTSDLDELSAPDGDPIEADAARNRLLTSAKRHEILVGKTVVPAFVAFKQTAFAVNLGGEVDLVQTMRSRVDDELARVDGGKDPRISDALVEARPAEKSPRMDGCA